MMERISKKAHYLEVAKAISDRSTCIRRRYGCVIVKNDEIIATGYNGSPRGHANCCDVGSCYRETMNIPHGEQYEKCIAVHAEQNAIISASRRDMIGSIMYLTGFDADSGEQINAEPCLICSRMLANAGVRMVVNEKGSCWKNENY